ncbi:MAG: hypothetical protein H0V88_10570 [Pyrinomonadaceae bacterium]|nr:hypothetical protein [Pyrinomonadaceae bacterium]
MRLRAGSDKGRRIESIERKYARASCDVRRLPRSCSRCELDAWIGESDGRGERVAVRGFYPLEIAVIGETRGRPPRDAPDHDCSNCLQRDIVLAVVVLLLWQPSVIEQGLLALFRPLWSNLLSSGSEFYLLLLVASLCVPVFCLAIVFALNSALKIKFD